MKNFNQEEFNNFIIENNIYGFFEEEITLVSGRISNFYINWRGLTNDVWLTDQLTDYIISFIKDNNIEVDTFYGVPEGATELGILTQYKWAKMSGYYSEKSHALAMGRAKPKDHGMAKDKFFVGMPRGRVVAIEDIVTVATNLLPSLDNLLAAGVNIVAAVILSNRMERRDDGLSVKQAVEEKGIQFFDMSNALEILPRVYRKLQPGESVGRKVEEYYKRYGVEELKLVKPKFLNKEISGVFTIPAGVITASPKIVEKIAKQIPEVGVITTKSIGLEPRQGNREPILAKYAPGSFINAVGLANPGAVEFARQLQEIKIPEDKFLLISIFGKDADEFVKVAKILAPYADGLELNLSCPHTEGYGMAIGQDENLVREIVKAVKEAVGLPLVAKLTANVPDITKIAQVAVEAGADAICTVNTVGPGYYTIDGHPVLTNQKGGISGKGILPLGLKCVSEISENIDLPIIGCGGISNANDVRAYQQAGAGIFGIGSALAGLSLEKLTSYFAALNNDLETGKDDASAYLQEVDMSFKQYSLADNQRLADDLSLLVFDKDIDIKPGQFVFVWLPEVGEKPFSVLDNQPLTLAVQRKGCFSEKLIDSEKGARVYFRGPYGMPAEIESSFKAVLVGGGTGVAALYQIARQFGDAEVFIGAKDREHLFYIDQLKEISNLYITTNDGSDGYGGYVTDLLEKKLAGICNENTIFFNCGPLSMIEKAIEIEKEYAGQDKIYSAIDYPTRCGVGLCGSCATKDGRRLCVDGPFIRE